MSEPVKITLGTRVIVDIGGAEFDAGTVYSFEWTQPTYNTQRIANPDGTFTTKIIGGQMRLELNCDLPILMEP